MIGSTLLATLFGCAAAPRPVSVSAWRDWKTRFLQDDGRVNDTGNAGISHTEGQGYGMLLAEAAGDRAVFDRIWGWTDTVLARRDVRLFSWKFEPKAETAVADPNDATDGDILIAWALLRAARRWGNEGYARHSRAIRVAIGTHLVVSVYGRIVLLPGLSGFVTKDRTTVNPSYYIWPALDAFRTADKDGPWGDVIAHGETLLKDSRFGAAMLPSDWIDLDATTLVRPAEGHPPRFGYDAIRVPLYLGWSGRETALAPFRSFWSDPANLVPWVDVLSGERAGYAMSTGSTAVAQVTMGQPVTGTITGSDDYYSATLFLLAQAAAQTASRGRA